MKILVNYDFWTAIIGFIGVLIPLLWNIRNEYIKNRKINNINNEVNNIEEKQRYAARIEALKKINQIERDENIKNNWLNRIVFGIITIAFALQLLGIIQNVKK
jgi:hypothetical protein